MHVTERLFGIRGAAAAIIGATPIGQATASLFAEAGANAVLIPTFEDDPGEGIDPQDETAIAASLDAILAAQGRLDILIYAATLPGAYPFTDTSLAQWDRLHAINLRGAFITFREAVKRMAPRQGGRIIAVSTMGALVPVLNGNAAYGSSKAGLNALVRAVALDHAKDNILVNAVLPGAVPVGPMAADARVPTGPAREPGRLLLGMGTAQDVAAAILYLASPAARFITGQTLTLDGGFLIA